MPASVSASLAHQAGDPPKEKKIGEGGWERGSRARRSRVAGWGVGAAPSRGAEVQDVFNGPLLVFVGSISLAHS